MDINTIIGHDLKVYRIKGNRDAFSIRELEVRKGRKGLHIKGSLYNVIKSLKKVDFKSFGQTLESQILNQFKYSALERR